MVISYQRLSIPLHRNEALCYKSFGIIAKSVLPTLGEGKLRETSEGDQVIMPKTVYDCFFHLLE